QAQVVTSAKGRSVAKNLAGPVRLGGQSEERQLLQSPIPSPASQARSEESHLRRRRLDADRYLPHAEGRNRTSRSRRRPLRPSFDRGQNQPPRRPTHQARLQGRTPTSCRRGMKIQTSQKYAATQQQHRTQPPPESFSFLLEIVGDRYRSRSRHSARRRNQGLWDVQPT